MDYITFSQGLLYEGAAPSGKMEQYSHLCPQRFAQISIGEFNGWRRLLDKVLYGRNATECCACGRGGDDV